MYKKAQQKIRILQQRELYRQQFDLLMVNNRLIDLAYDNSVIVYSQNNINFTFIAHIDNRGLLVSSISIGTKIFFCEMVTSQVVVVVSQSRKNGLQIMYWNLKTKQYELKNHKNRSQNVQKLIIYYFKASKLLCIIQHTSEKMQKFYVCYYKFPLQNNAKPFYQYIIQLSNHQNLRMYKANNQSMICLAYYKARKSVIKMRTYRLININQQNPQNKISQKFTTHIIQYNLNPYTLNCIDFQIRQIFQVTKQYFYIQLSSFLKKNLISKYDQIVQTSSQQKISYLEKFHNIYWDSQNKLVKVSKIQNNHLFCLQFLSNLRNVAYKYQPVIQKRKSQQDSNDQKQINLPIYYIDLQGQKIQAIQQTSNIQFITWSNYSDLYDNHLMVVLKRQNPTTLKILQVPSIQSLAFERICFFERLYTNWDADLMIYAVQMLRQCKSKLPKSRQNRRIASRRKIERNKTKNAVEKQRQKYKSKLKPPLPKINNICYRV